MTATTPACEMRRHVEHHFAGTIEPASERAMREHLASCDACRARYRRRALFAKLDPGAMPPEERIARGLGILAAPAHAATARGLFARGARFAPEATVLAAAAALLLFLQAPRDDEGFRARGRVDPSAASVGSAAASAALPGVRVYRLARDGRPRPADGFLKKDDELAFAYENPEGKPYLMIFAVDDREGVYWFYPAWTDAAEDPPAVHASPEPGVHALGEAVRHRFEGSRIEIHAVFLDNPVTVRQMEAAVARGATVGADRVKSFVLLPDGPP